MSLPPHRVPAHPEFAGVLFDVFRLRVQRVMRRGVTDVQKKRLVFFREFFDALDGVIGEGIRRVVVVRKLRDILVVVAELPNAPALVLRVTLFWVEEIAATVEQPIILVKTAPVRMRRLAGTKVPLAAERRLVSGQLHRLAQRDHVLPQQPALAAARIEAGQDRRPRCGALGVVVKLGEPHPLRREAVEARRADLAPIAADVTPAHIVAHDQHDVWPLRRLRSAQGQAKRKACSHSG